MNDVAAMRHFLESTGRVTVFNAQYFCAMRTRTRSQTGYVDGQAGRRHEWVNTQQSKPQMDLTFEEPSID